jgi:uncharacterized protein (DUF342 family)
MCRPKVKTIYSDDFSKNIERGRDEHIVGGKYKRDDNSVQLKLDRKYFLKKQLQEQNRQIDFERKRYEEEEEKVRQSIQNLKVTEYELDKRRLERERLQREIEKKKELERLRAERLLLLKKQEESLTRRLIYRQRY